MKKHMIVGTALALGLLSFGAISATAAQACEGCTDKQAMQQFTQATSNLQAALKAKEIQLRELYGYDSLDTREASRLEAEVKDLKAKIDASAQKLGVQPCVVATL